MKNSLLTSKYIPISTQSHLPDHSYPLHRILQTCLSGSISSEFPLTSNPCLWVYQPYIPHPKLLSLLSHFHSPPQSPFSLNMNRNVILRIHRPPAKSSPQHPRNLQIPRVHHHPRIHQHPPLSTTLNHIPLQPYPNHILPTPTESHHSLHSSPLFNIKPQNPF